MAINTVLIIVVLLFAFRFFASAKGISQISTEQLKGKLKQGNTQLVDVRTPLEFNAGSIKGFKNIPLSELNKRSNELSKDQEVIIICQSGMRSTKAGRVLQKKGYSLITNVKGGMNAWH
ncbi:rhodanese-like domain-containing protein [Jeotgalibacillus sp. S-D1]|nr:rhodanese-like domain-containing protein [Jeotgalibacillus sp. S-D1]